MTGSCTVYGIYDPLGELRYVGQTKHPLWRRLADHIAKASPTDPRPVLRWLWEVYSAGGVVTIAPLKLNAALGRDEQEIIKRLTGEGCSLLNVDVSAQVSARMTPEYRAQIGAAVRAGMTPERRAKISASLTGRPKSPETRAKMSAATKGRIPWQKKGVLNGVGC